MQPKLRIYVASKSDERGMGRTRAFLDAAADLGFEPALDWTALIAEARAAGWATDADVPDDVRRSHADADLTAAITCDVFVYLGPEPERSEGAAGELCAAITASRLAHRPLVVAVGGQTLFALLAHQRFTRDDDALAYLRRMVGRAA